MSILDDLISRIDGAPEAQREAIAKDAIETTKHMKWVPNPGPQTDAYFSKADVLLYGGEPGGGKLLSINTPIPIPHGWSTMGEIQIGDMVIDENGLPCNVTAKSGIETEKTYLMIFSDGSEIVAGARHQWVTSSRTERMRELKCNDEWRARRREARKLRGKGKRPDLALRNSISSATLNLPTMSIRTTQEIADSITLSGGRANHAIAMAGSLQLPIADLLIDPYVLGAWLGDGSSSAGSITGIDEELFLQVANFYPVRKQPSNKYGYGVLGLQSQLKMLGLFNNKHIPIAYLRSSHDQRIALLQGLMDTDGHCDKRGQCEIQLTNKQLVDGLQELILSLGIKVQMRDGIAKLNGRQIGPKWRLKFLTHLPVFRLSRKLIRQKRDGFRGTHEVRYIKHCVEIDPVPMQCIQVDSQNHMYLCGRAMIPTHNSQLVLGLAFNEHQRSVIMRRQYGDLDRIVEDALKIHGSRAGFNGSPPPKLKISDKQVIDFAAAHRIGDEQGQMGKGRDFIAFDEATHFAESQIRFVMGWNRTEDPNQRCRVVLATNPPLTAEGLWVMEMFAPWLNPQYPDPAKPGELRWVISDEDGKDRWVDGSGQYEVNGKMMSALSRTYIPASVKDNPYYVASGYEKQLDAMPEPYRSLLMGGFRTSFKDLPNQIIPTAWITAAQKRWNAQPPRDVPMCTMGVDASGGGEDPMIIASRYDGWFSELIEVPGKEIPMERSGAHCGGIVISHRRDQALVVIDMGGGYGGPMYEHLHKVPIEVKAYKGAEKTTRRSSDGKMYFTNKRSAAYWYLREALDPGQPGGSPIALPHDPKLVADLTAPTFEVTPNGIKAEPKEKVCERLGRSTDRGDAVVMSWFEGPRQIENALEWMQRKEECGLPMGRRPVVVPRGRTPLTAGKR